MKAFSISNSEDLDSSSCFGILLYTNNTLALVKNIHSIRGEQEKIPINNLSKIKYISITGGINNKVIILVLEEGREDEGDILKIKQFSRNSISRSIDQELNQTPWVED